MLSELWLTMRVQPEPNARSNDALRIPRKRPMVQAQTRHPLPQQNGPVQKQNVLLPRVQTLPGFSGSRGRFRSRVHVFLAAVQGNDAHPGAGDLRPRDERHGYDAAKGDYGVGPGYDYSEEP